MEAKAIGKRIRISAQKVRIVADLVRGKPVGDALDLLSFEAQQPAAVVKKVLESAIANAENNNNLSSDALKIESAIVEQGPAFKRFRPAARGSAHPYKKPTSHIRIVLSDEA